MKNGSLEQFLDCLDFAPDVIKDMIKDLAVELPLNDMAKRQAIQDKLGFDVTKAIEIANRKVQFIIGAFAPIYFYIATFFLKSQ